MAANASLSLLVPISSAHSLAVSGGILPEALHLTLGFFGRVSAREDWQEMINLLAPLKGKWELQGEVDHYGRWPMSEGEGDIFWAGCSVSGLEEFRAEAVKLISPSFTPRNDFGKWSPHITLAEVASGVVPEGLADLPLVIKFETMRLRLGREKHFDLSLT